MQRIPAGDHTVVPWAMDGPTRYITRLFTVFVSMDSMLGKNFDRGLRNLDAEASVQAPQTL